MLCLIINQVINWYEINHDWSLKLYLTLGRSFIIYPLSFIRIKCLELPMGDLEVDHDIIIIIMYKVSRSKFKS